ncbi:MAG: hypothetical protein JWN93_194, partial [Hyphomicrobiales bacterium]|nr:hypothetical protein [Hyphomicrobiales bacterium]
MPHLVFSRFLRARPFASALVLGALLGDPAFAQSDRKPDERRTEDRWRGPPPHQLLDRVDARIAQMKADLRLTEEQNQHWEGFRK